MKLLKERIFPALVITLIALAILIPLSIFGNKQVEARLTTLIFLMIFAGILVYEFFNAMRLKIYLSLIFASIAMLSILFPYHFFNQSTIYLDNLDFVSNFKETSIFIGNYVKQIALDYISVIIILVIAICFFIVELRTRRQKIEDSLLRMLYVFITIYVLTNGIKIFNLLIDYSYIYWIVIVLITVSYDILGFLGGNFFGKKWFKKPFAQIISPNKTWEGFLFGIIGGWIISFSLTFSLGLFSSNNIGLSIFLQALFALFSPFIVCLGDLFFSLIKRINGVKDYSKIFKGHGGFLDRFDGLMFCLFFSFLIFLF
ncbi:phosphatidate cytidylyltransferase [Mycoplasmopsis meleagridis]|uniref:phosphatidate cytidylyltransferase n=1 Tax=Mycoplasmopsis meleagridis TaxID=29561 RepID=UPI003A893CB6